MQKPTIKIRTTATAAGLEVKLLVRHPMQNRVVDEDGRVLVAAHHITLLDCFVDETLVYQAEMGTGISKNPFFAFVIPATFAARATTLRVSWRDNQGASETREFALG